MVARLDGAMEKPLRLVTHTPPRHGKTDTLLRWAVRLLRRYPRLRVAYVSYSASIAESKSWQALQIARAVGVPLDPELQKRSEWHTRMGGYFLATGVGGPLTGQGVDILIIDDPVKNRAEAESALMRDRTWDWFNDVGYTRLEPGASVIVNMARWHRDDLAGRLVEGKGWGYLKLCAIHPESGAALWPERRTLQELLEIRSQVGEYTWASLYQGEPTPRGGAVFRGCAFAPPPKEYRLAVGLDFAYSEKTRADYSVAVVLMHGEGRYHIPHVLRGQMESPAFGRELAALKLKYPGASWYTYVTGPEKGIVDFINTFGLKVEMLPMQGDKLVRAQPSAAAWNGGSISIPAQTEEDPSPEWVGKFVEELCDFTGVKDAHDDQVDALAAAYNGLTFGHRWRDWMSWAPEGEG